jgi:gluconate kinase
VSIGERQPAARDAIHTYLDTAVGTAGGPVSDKQRAAWVDAYRNLARAAADATR